MTGNHPAKFRHCHRRRLPQPVQLGDILHSWVPVGVPVVADCTPADSVTANPWPAVVSEAPSVVALAALTVIADPRLDKLTVMQAGMERQLALELKLVQAIDASHKAFDQLTQLHDRLAGQETPAELAQKLAAIQGPPGDAVSDPYGTVPGAGSISHDQGAFVRLLVAVDYNSDMPPVEGQIQAWRDNCANYNRLLAQWRTAMAHAPASLQAGAPPAALDCR